MLQIRLNKGSSMEGGGVAGAKPIPAETVMVACPDHLVLADLPVAKGLGSATSASSVKVIGRRSRRTLGDRVHFCVRCDFPIAIYGRLSPCEHAFCLDCARSDSICYLCDERIQKIQTIKMMEGIFVCAAPHCLKSFLKKTDFEAHILDSHSDLLRPNAKKEEVNEPEASATKQSSTLDTTLRGPARPGFPSNPQLNDRDDNNKSRRQQPRERDQSAPTRPAMQQDFGQFSDKQQQQQQGIQPDPHHREYIQYPQQNPNYAMPINANPMMMGPPPFGFPPFPSDGPQPSYGGPGPYEVARSDSAAEASGPGGPVGFPEGFPRPWGMGPGNVAFDHGSQGILPPPPPPPPPHMMQHKHGYYSGDMSTDGKNYGWQSDRRDSFGNGQD